MGKYFILTFLSAKNLSISEQQCLVNPTGVFQGVLVAPRRVGAAAHTRRGRRRLVVLGALGRPVAVIEAGDEGGPIDEEAGRGVGAVLIDRVESDRDRVPAVVAADFQAGIVVGFSSGMSRLSSGTAAGLDNTENSRSEIDRASIVAAKRRASASARRRWQGETAAERWRRRPHVPAWRTPARYG